MWRSDKPVNADAASTDDTQMMIALAESLIERERIDNHHLPCAFTEAYEPDRGYGGGTRRVFELWADGTPVALAAAQIFDGRGHAETAPQCGSRRSPLSSATTSHGC
jgi:ADP-ribosylglycohydrolase